MMLHHRHVHGAGGWRARILRLVLPPQSIQPPHIFMLFYTVALVADFDGQVIGAGTVIALSAWVAFSLTRESFLVLLITSTAYFVLYELPDTENHTNLLIFTNVALTASLVYSYTFPDSGDENTFYDVAQPIARLSIIIALAVAGFHKLNRDFINPDASCVGIFARSIAQIAVTSDFANLGLPPLVFLILMFAVMAVMLWRRRAEIHSPRVDWLAIGTVMLVMFLAMIPLATIAGDAHTYGLVDLTIFFLAVAVLCWQLIEAPLLLLARFQWVALSFSLLIHAQLAMMRIVDFQAIAIALFIAFVPPNVWHAWDRQAYAPFGPVRMHRAQLYYLLNVVGALIMLAQTLGFIEWDRPLTAWGMLFIGGLLVMLWPIISDLFSPIREWRWEGVPVFNGVAPVWLYAVPLALLLFGLTSHLGLRTAGNLSMYSNLRTEAGQNNHLLLGADPLKLAAYQEDVVHILDIGDEAAIRPYLNRWGQLEGNLLPVVEFRKLLLKWRENQDIVPMTVEYKGTVTVSPNIVENPEWQVERTDWEMRLMDFRVIQSQPGPNACRW